MIYTIINIFALLLYITYGKIIELKVIAFNIADNDEIYSNLINDFNNYSNENNLNITVSLNTLVNSINLDSFGSMIETLFIKGSNKYDLYFYDNAFTQKYGEYLLDLNKYLPKEHIEIFNQQLISESCIYKGKLVGLPYNVGYTMLFSNDILLNKYNKTIPKTWKELIDTSKYIMERENNTDIIAYNGLLDESEHGICSIYEFLYSCRDSKNSPFPDLTSETAINALNLLKEIKNEIASDEIFKSDINYSTSLLFEGKALFAKFWSLPYSLINTLPYRTSILPGIKEGISGSSIAGYNLGIDGHIKIEKLNAAIEALKFLTSKETQKKYLIKENLVSGITSLYDEKEICKQANCEFFKNVQPIGRPASEKYSISEYYKRINTYIHQYLYENKTASETLEQIDDLTRVHFISRTKKDTKIFALSHIIIVITLSIIMLLSLQCLYLKKIKIYFYYLTNDLWIISLLGLIVILNASLTTLGPVTSFKCNLYISLIVVGYTLNLIPFLYILIINFPEENKISKLIFHHKYIFLFAFILIDFIFIALHSLKIYRVKELFLYESKSFKICSINGTYGLVVLALILVFYLIIILTILLLCYIEWNYKGIIYDVRNIIFSIYTNILSILLLFLSNYIHSNNYIVYFVLINLFIIIFIISNFISIYIYRILLCFNKKKNEEITLYVNTIFNLRTKNSHDIYSSNIYSEKSVNSSRNNESSNRSTYSNGKISTKSSIILKIVNYHNSNSSNSYKVNSYFKDSNEKTNNSFEYQ